MESDEKICPKCAETIKAAAVVCKHCGYSFEGTMPPTPEAARKHRLRNGCLIFVVALVGLGILGSLAGKSGSASSSPAGGIQDAATSPEPDLIKVTARELAQAYEANEAAAQQQYGAGPLLVTGTIASINLGITDQPFLVLAGTNAFLGPQAELSDASKPDASKLSKGQKIVMTCVSVSEIVGTPMLKDCTIVEDMKEVPHS